MQIIQKRSITKAKLGDLIECYDKAIQVNPNNQLTIKNKKIAIIHLKNIFE